MKAQSESRKRSISQMADKRDLVNLDFYDNEILIMQHKLNKLTGGSYSTETKKKIQDLIHELDNQKYNLEEFRKSFDVEEMLLSEKRKPQDKKLKNQNQTNGIKGDENFFFHLQSFENSFKDLRQEVLEFLYKQEQGK